MGCVPQEEQPGVSNNTANRGWTEGVVCVCVCVCVCRGGGRKRERLFRTLKGAIVLHMYGGEGSREER